MMFQKVCKRNKFRITDVFVGILMLWGVGQFNHTAIAQVDSLSSSEILSLSTPVFELSVDKRSQTAVSLSPVVDPQFNYTTGEWAEVRKGDGFYQLGDINLKVRQKGASQWVSYSSAAHRSPVESLNHEGNGVLTAAKLSNSLSKDIALEITRFWESKNGNLVLRFELKNKNSEPIEVGALGIPMIFNNILHEKHLDEVHAENVFFDPYIGMDAGYLQAVRLSGEGPVLLVLPHEKTPFEAYRPLLDDPMPRGITFEGFHEWMVHSKAYAENEWQEADPWNRPTSMVLAPGETYSVGVEFVLADNVQNIEETLIKHHKPVAIGFPGYVLPQDVQGSLFLTYEKEIRSIDVEPEGALVVKKVGTTSHGWDKYAVNGVIWGRARLSVTYTDGTVQTINYKVIKPESEVVADNGHFLLTEQWFDKKNDPFGRAPSVISYDYEKKEKITQDSRAWIAGLSDEGGAGSWLNAIMKQLVQPDPEEVAKMEDFVNQTMWGGIQYSIGEHKYGVRKSLFYYEPDSMPEGTYSDEVNYKTWAAWSKEAAETVGRSYNYPHVAAAHWVMYRLARNYNGLVTQRAWEWYLENAFHTAIAMVEQAPYYAQFGQMEGTIFILVLEDLKREGWTELAQKLESTMRKRAEHWASLNYPFGSEMPWDSTGQEEVYMWSKYFGFDEKASITLNAILAYMPTIPHWGYNGCARRYWDFLFGGKLSRVERQIHHYGSALNAIPVLHAFKEVPDNLYLLRVGYGGLMGALSNITKDGFAPCAFHSFPSTLRNDGISGDYGPGFFGYAVNTASFLVMHDEFGWISMGGNIINEAEWITMELTTAARSKVFIAPAGVELSLDAGKFKTVSFHPESGEIKIVLDSRNEYTPKAFLQVKFTGDSENGEYKVLKYSKNDRGIYSIPLKKKERTVRVLKGI
ncbi:DUF5695 domain-containing protein [Thermophagus sp. OGC60D27]|uniref:DUF5695 domain-containing protein n=1 Tax=Thermophagus sp. OGC60D27 TaxID=3458415 RepID=UPI004037AB1F